MKKFLKIMIRRLYSMFFGAEPGPVAGKFIRNIGYVSMGFGLAKILSLIFQVYAGRVMGPEVYGGFSVIIATSSILWVPMVGGLNLSITKYLSEKRDDREIKVIISTGISIFLVLVPIFVTAFSLMASMISSMISIPLDYFYASMVLAVGYAFWILAKNMAQGLREMKKVGAIEFSRSFFTFIFFLLLTSFSKEFLKIGIFALLVAYLASTIFIVPEIKRYVNLKIDYQVARTLGKYGIFALVGSIATQVLVFIDRIFLKVYLDAEQVGIYQAYIFATLGILGFFTLVFLTVYFPEASFRDKMVVWKRTKKVFGRLPILFVAIYVGGYTIIRYGYSYPINLSYLFLLSLLSMIITVNSTYYYFLNAISIEGAKKTMFSRVLASIFVILGDIILIPRIQIAGAILAMMSAYLVSTYYLEKSRRDIFEKLNILEPD
jgi:O-antigen/teichoic acid export membrane protein